MPNPMKKPQSYIRFKCPCCGYLKQRVGKCFNCGKLPTDSSSHESSDAKLNDLKAAVSLMGSALNTFASKIHAGNHQWWHNKDGVRLQRNKGELLCLIHSEISEAMEGERKDLMDDKLPHRKMAEVELADALIRILDYAAGFGYDIGGAVMEKLVYNKTRHDHTHEARAKAGGKKW